MKIVVIAPVNSVDASAGNIVAVLAYGERGDVKLGVNDVNPEDGVVDQKYDIPLVVVAVNSPPVHVIVYNVPDFSIFSITGTLGTLVVYVTAGNLAVVLLFATILIIYICVKEVILVENVVESVDAFTVVVVIIVDGEVLLAIVHV